MAREDTMICMDTSEWMRNGDYTRTRFEAQYQAIEYVLRIKTTNPENTVGLLSLSSSSAHGVQLLCSPTTERFRVGKAANNAPIGGKADLITGIKVAQLALKNRTNRQISARIICFIGSPLVTAASNSEEYAKKLASLAKQLKRSNISMDIVLIGEHETNQQLCENFIKAVRKEGENKSTLVVVEVGSFVEDAIKASEMVTGGGSGQAAGGFGFDDEDDAIMQQVMRESLEMANAQNQMNNPDNATSTAVSTKKDAEKDNKKQNMEEDEDDEMDEDAILEQAKLMSMMNDAKDKKDKDKDI